MTTKFDSWNPEKGFGFVTVEGKRVYVHVTVISPRPVRGANLMGWFLASVDVDWGAEKGPTAKKAVLQCKYRLQESTRYVANGITAPLVVVISAPGIEVMVDLGKPGSEIAPNWPPKLQAAVNEKLVAYQLQAGGKWIGATVTYQMNPPGFILNGGEFVPYRAAREQGCPEPVVKGFEQAHLAWLKEQGIRGWDAEYLLKQYKEYGGGVAALNRKLFEAKTNQVKAALIPNPRTGTLESTALDAYRKATVCTPPASDLVVIHESRTSDNDGKGDRYRTNTANVRWYEHTAAPEYSSELDPNFGAGVTICMEVKVGEGEQTAARSYSTASHDIFRREFQAIEEPTSEVWEQQYRTSTEGAAAVWQHCQWFLVSREELALALEHAKNIQAARSLWSRIFPGIEPGDRQGAWKKQLEGLPWISDGWLNTEGDWINTAFWHVPPQLLRDLNDLLAERAEILQRLAAEGNARALELLEAEAVGLFWEEIWTTLETTTLGLRWDKEWHSRDSDFIATGPVPVLTAFVGEEEVATTEVWYGQRSDRAYYRVWTDKITPPIGYRSGTLEWRAVDHVPVMRPNR